MKTVLNQMSTLPGVVGSMVYDADGQVLAKVFPSLFDANALADAAGILVYGASGLEVAAGTISMLDLRFRESRIVVRPFKGAALLVYCTSETNLQFLNISLGMAIPKLEKLLVSQAAQRSSGAAAPPQAESNALPGASIEEKAQNLKGFEKVFLKMDTWMRKQSGE